MPLAVHKEYLTDITILNDKWLHSVLGNQYQCRSGSEKLNKLFPCGTGEEEEEEEGASGISNEGCVQDLVLVRKSDSLATRIISERSLCPQGCPWGHSAYLLLQRCRGRNGGARSTGPKHPQYCR